MKMRFEHRDGIGVLWVDEARIDATVAIQFKDRFRDLTQGAMGDVIVDLNRVDFLDSSGLGALVAARKLLGPGRIMGLCGLTPAVDRVMVLTRMHSIFPIHIDLATALAARVTAS